jgi:hypothetical protein
MVQNPHISRMQHFTPDTGVDIWVYKNPSKIYISAARPAKVYVTYADWTSGVGAHPNGGYPPYNKFKNSLLYLTSNTPTVKTEYYSGGNNGTAGWGGYWMNKDAKDATLAVSTAAGALYYKGKYTDPTIYGTPVFLAKTILLTTTQVTALFKGFNIPQPAAFIAYVITIFGDTGIYIYGLSNVVNTDRMTATLITSATLPAGIAHISRDGTKVIGFDSTINIFYCPIIYTATVNGGYGNPTPGLIGAAVTWGNLGTPALYTGGEDLTVSPNRYFISGNPGIQEIIYTDSTTKYFYYLYSTVDLTYSQNFAVSVSSSCASSLIVGRINLATGIVENSYATLFSTAFTPAVMDSGSIKTFVTVLNFIAADISNGAYVFLEQITGLPPTIKLMTMNTAQVSPTVSTQTLFTGSPNTDYYMGDAMFYGNPIGVTSNMGGLYLAEYMAYNVNTQWSASNGRLMVCMWQDPATITSTTIEQYVAFINVSKGTVISQTNAPYLLTNPVPTIGLTVI